MLKEKEQSKKKKSSFDIICWKTIFRINLKKKNVFQNIIKINKKIRNKKQATKILINVKVLLSK